MTTTPEEVVLQPRDSSFFLKLGFAVLVILGFLSAFGAGYFMNQLLGSGKGGPDLGGLVSPLPVSSPRTSSRPVASSMPAGSFTEVLRFDTGRHYFDDTIMVVSKTAPHHTLIATVNRLEGAPNTYTQNTRASFFDGTTWTRKLEVNNTQSPNIATGGMVKEWQTTIDGSRVLKEESRGSLEIEGTNISFATGVLNNEIPIRSMPGYTKFLSEGEGKIVINGVPESAYVLYTRIYSLNADNIQFYNQPLGLTTDWLVFWDEMGNVYHLDTTQVPAPTPIYQTHQVAVMETNDGGVYKTFQVGVDRNQTVPPSQYTINLANPIGRSLNLNLLNSINKAPDNSYQWYLGQVSGEVELPDGKKIKGIGLVEYIHN
jgi:hypothetical protein